MGLTFRDIDKWKPASISIVDYPSHPMAVFEVYEDDEEFIRKFIDGDESMTNNNNVNGDGKVSISERLFEKLLGGGVSKAEPVEPPVREPVRKPEPKEEDDDLEKRVANLEEKLDQVIELLKKEPSEEPKKTPEPPEGVRKYVEVEGVKFYPETENREEEGLEILDDGVRKYVEVEGIRYYQKQDNPLEEGVSKSLDIDNLASSNNTEEATLLERIGRTNSGLKKE